MALYTWNEETLPPLWAWAAGATEQKSATAREDATTNFMVPPDPITHAGVPASSLSAPRRKSVLQRLVTTGLNVESHARGAAKRSRDVVHGSVQ
jgi:hypothetical protein